LIAIITLAFLSVILLSYLLSSVNAWDRTFMGAALLKVCVEFSAMCLTIVSSKFLTCRHGFIFATIENKSIRMRQLNRLTSLLIAFFANAAKSICRMCISGEVFNLCRLQLFTPETDLFRDRDMWPSSLKRNAEFVAFLAFIAQKIRGEFTGVKILLGCWLALFTDSALFLAASSPGLSILNERLQILLSAFSTPITKPIFLGFIGVEKFSSCGLPCSASGTALAGRAVLRYSISHSESSLLAIGLGCSEHRQPQQYYPHYSITPPLKQAEVR